MTTIAYRDGVLAADRQTTCSGVAAVTTKIWRVNDSIIAVIGDGDQGMEMLRWIENGAIPADFPASQRSKEDWARVIKVVRGDPKPKLYVYERTPYPFELFDEYFASGSGRDFALAAMYLGKTAEQAIEVAAVFDLNTGKGVESFTI